MFVSICFILYVNAKQMLVNTFVKMLIRVEGLPTKATNIGPPLTIMILQYIDTLLIIHVCKNIKTVDTGVNVLK